MQQPDPVQVQHMMLAMMPIFVLMGIIGSAVMVVPFWVIFKKAGASEGGLKHRGPGAAEGSRVAAGG